MVYMTGFCTKVIFKVRICGRFFGFAEPVLTSKLTVVALNVVSMFCMLFVFHKTKRKKSGG